MIRMSVRDIRLHWPEAEKNIDAHGEIVVTRDGKPVARIVPWVEPAPASRQRFDPQRQAEWLRQFWRAAPEQPSTDELLARERED